MSDDGDASTSVATVCTFRKVAKKRTQMRQRQAARHSESEHSSDGAEVVKDVVSKRRRQNPMIQSTKRSTTRTTGHSSSDESSEDNLGLPEHAFAATGSAAPLGPKDMGATATLEVDTEEGKDAQSQFERVQKQLDEGMEKDGKLLYKGSAMYGAKKAKDTAKGNASSGMNRVGPVRAPQFLRQTVRWDFAPDLCKDYKETGFCTFGDSCKFMHDRGDYKHGWEIERDWAAGKMQKKEEENYEIGSDEDDLPDECQICNEPFKEPVVTRCRHYFCESCAIAAFRKSKKCQVCNENTGGVFNRAKDIIEKMSNAAPAKKPRGSDSGEDSGREDDEDKEREDTHMELLIEEEQGKDEQDGPDGSDGEDGGESDEGEAIENEA